MLVNLLEPIGFDLLEAEDGQPGFEKTLLYLPDLVITDIAMPVMNGLEMVKQLRAHSETRSIPIIASSASVFNFDRQQSREAGCTDFLPKPVQAEELLNQLQQWLELSWIYETEAAIAPQAASPELPPQMPLPAIEVLKTIQMAARIGDIRAVEQAARAIDREYPVFAQAILQFAQAFDDKAILNFLNPYLANSSAQEVKL